MELCTLEYPIHLIDIKERYNWCICHVHIYDRAPKEPQRLKWGPRTSKGSRSNLDTVMSNASIYLATIHMELIVDNGEDVRAAADGVRACLIGYVNRYTYSRECIHSDTPAP